MAKKLKTSEVKLDDDLNFDFDFDINGAIDQEAKVSDDRTPIKKVVVGALDGVKSTATSPDFIRAAVRESLPKQYGEIEDNVQHVREGIGDLYDEAVREVKPKIGQIAERLDKLVPEERSKLKGIIGKLKEFGGIKSFSGPDEFDRIEQTVSTAVGEVFKKNLEEKEQVQGRIRDKRKILEDAMTEKRHGQTTQILDEIRTDVSRSTQYQLGVTQSYQKKMLELQVRSYLTQAEQLRTSQRYFEAFKAQFESIIKNTALPEHVKITGYERFKEVGLRRMSEGLQNKMFGEGSAIRRGFTRLKEKGQEVLQGVSRGLESLDFALEGAGSAAEQITLLNQMNQEAGLPPISKTEMAAAQASAIALQHLREKVTAKIRERAEKQPALVRKLTRVARGFRNIPGEVDQFQRSEWFQTQKDKVGVQGWIAKGADFVMDAFKDEKSSQRQEMGVPLSQLGQPTAGFDKRAHLSLVEIIPGHLAAIRQQVTMFNTKDPKTPLMTYDFQRGEFVGKRAMAVRIQKQLENEFDQSGIRSNLNDAVRMVAGDKQLSPEEQKAIAKFFTRISKLENFVPNEENIKDTRAYRELDKHVVEILDRYFEENMPSGEDEETRAKRELSLYNLTDRVKGVQQQLPTMNGLVKNLINAGYGDLIAKSGLWERDSSGGFNVNEEKFEEFLLKNLDRDMVRSDINVKQAIRQMNPRDLLATVKERFSGKRGEFDARTLLQEKWNQGNSARKNRKNWDPKQSWEGLKNIKLFNWKYKPGVGDEQPHSGPMAQDVRQKLGEEAAPGGKSLDLQSLNGAMMASVQHLGGKLEKFKEWVTGRFEDESESKPTGKSRYRHPSYYLKPMQEDIRAIRKQGGMGGVGAGTLPGGFMPGSGGSFSDAVTQTAVGLSTIATKIASSIMAATTGLFNAGKDYVAKPIFKLLGDNKETFKEGFSSLLKKTFRLGSSILDFGNKAVTEIIPDSLKWIKDKASGLVKTVMGSIRSVKDLYLPGELEPAIKAVKLKAGHYRDRTTGKILETMDDVLAAKGHIVDEFGNIVVSAKELANGLWDANGERIRSMGQSIAKFTTGAAIWAAKKAKDGLMAIKNAGGSALDYFKGKFDKFKGSNPFSGFDGLGGYGRENHQVLVDIRDILLGDASSVRKRLKKKATGASPFAMSTVAIDQDDEDMSDPSEMVASGSPEARYQGGGIGSIFSKGRDLVNTVRDSKTWSWGRDKLGGLKDKFGKASGATDKAATGLKGRLSTLPGKARGMLGKGLGLLGKVGGMFAGESEAPGAEKPSQTPQQQAQNQQPSSSPRKRRKKKSTVPALERAWNDKDGDGRRDGSVEDRLEKLSDLKEKRVKGPRQVDLTARYQGGPGIGEILSKAAGVFKMAQDGFGKLFDMGESVLDSLPDRGGNSGRKSGPSRRGRAGGKRLAGKLARRGAQEVGERAAQRAAGKVAEKAAGKAAQTAATEVAKRGAVRTLLSGGLKAGWGALKLGATKAIPVAAAGVAKAASALAGSISMPVVLTVAAVAAIGYGLWRLYKWNRGRKAEPYDLIRFAQYGFPNQKPYSDYHEHLGKLEQYLEDGRLVYQRGQVTINGKKATLEEMLELFSIDQKDKEAVNNFFNWFSGRFKPFFLNHKTVLYGIDPKAKFIDIPDWTLEQKVKYLEAAGFDSLPYEEITSPVKGVDQLPSNKKEVKAQIDLLMQEVKDKSKTDLKTSAKNKTEADKAKAAQDVAKAAATTAAAVSAEQKKTEEERRREADKRKLEASKKTTDLNKSQSLSESEDGPKEADKVAEMRNQGSNVIPLAKGPLFEGHGGRQFLRLGDRNVDIENLHPGVLKNLLGMAEEYGQLTGKTIQLNSAKRSFEMQAELHRRYPGKAAPPGRSLHEYGLAIDANSVDLNQLEKLGLMRKYGFTRPVGQEPWHMEPAGVQTNLMLAKNNAEERDKMVEFSPGRGGGGAGILPNMPKYKRNNEIAMAALHAGDREVDTSKDRVTQTLDGAKLVAASGQGEVSSANDDKMQNSASKESYQAQNRAEITQSKSRQLQTPPQATSNQDAEPGPKETQAGVGGSSSSASSNPSSIDEVKKEIGRYAQETGLDPGMVQTVAAVESDFRTDARPSTSSASGPFQFLQGTWKEQVGRYGRKHNVSANSSPSNVRDSTLMFSEYLKSNLRFISSIKPNPNIVDAYLTHFLGAGGARSFLSANGTAIGAEVLPKAAASNKNLFYQNGRALTITEIYDLLGKKLMAKAKHYGITIPANMQPTKFGQQGAPSSNSAASSPVGAVRGSTSAANDPLMGGAESSGQMAGSNRNQQTNNSSIGSGLAFLDHSVQPEDRGGRQSSAPPSFAGPSMSGVEDVLGKSLGVQKEMLDTLKLILRDHDPAKLTVALAQLSKNTSEQGRSVEPPNQNNQRTSGTSRGGRDMNPVLDLQRKSI